MTTPAGVTRIFAAITPEETDRLYDAPTRDRLAELGEVTWSHDGSLPADLADAYDVLITSWSTRKFEPRAVIGERLRLAVHTAGTIRGLFPATRSEEHTSELQSRGHLVCRLLLEKKKKQQEERKTNTTPTRENKRKNETSDK